ncbi:hypothetical protein [Rhizobium alvei]|uniref:Transmembrane protein n=1 Tax=Rhizobium alvei TaxID=1132659 RepID=A0ABT8YUV8_9HYPH|nr:hypothetical protein [Rhizobium alvei]MDO6967042.1 hypothetical protein [Rhizobium alvei]
MEVIQNRLVLVLSIIALMVGGLWFISAPSLETASVFIPGLIGVAANLRLMMSFGKPPRHASNADLHRYRQGLRKQFSEYINTAAAHDLREDCIVHDIERLDQYPNIDERDGGVSPWFRVGLMGATDEGVLIGYHWTYATQVNGEWYEDHSEDLDRVKVMLIGVIPYEQIEDVNFEGDDFYNKPHIYCHFAYNGEPSKRMFFGVEHKDPHSNHRHYSDLGPFKLP